jgi:hypothetical protein
MRNDPIRTKILSVRIIPNAQKDLLEAISGGILK